MRRRLIRRIGIEAALGLVSLALSVLTFVNAEWIEEVTGLEPDAGSGALEWAIALGFAAAAIVLALLAWRDRRQLAAVAS